MKANQKITYFNPNTKESIEKQLPKLLAEAILNKLKRDHQKSHIHAN